MVVLDQHHRLGRVLDLFEHCLGELAIDVLIVLPVLRPKNGPGVGDVTKRPQTFIRKAVVVTFFLLLAQPHPAQGIARIVGRNAQAIVRVHDFGVGVSAAVCDPGSIAGVEYRFQSSHQAARRHYHFERFAISLVHVGLAIRDDKKPAAVQTSLDLHCQPVRRPHGFRGFPQAGFIFRGVARLTEAFCQRGYFPRQRPE